MNVYELFAKLSLDTSDYERGLEDSKSEAKSAGNAIENSLGNAASGSEKKLGGLGSAAKQSGESIGGLGEKAKETSEKTVGLGDGLDSITQKLGISLPDGAKQALNGMEGFSAGSVAKMAAVAGSVAAVITVMKELSDLTLEAAAKADELLTRSAQTGIDVELLQALDSAQRYLDFEGIDQTLVKLTQTMGAAKDGAKEQSAAFQALGISVTNADGELKNNYDTFLEVIDALGEVENATERDTIANNLFGKSYSQMKPLIDAGTGELKKFTEAAKENGLVLTNDQVKKLGEVDDAHQHLTETIDASKNMIAVQWAPAVTKAMETFAEFVQKASKTLYDSKVIEGLGSVVQSILDIIEVGANLMDALPSWINPIQNISREFKSLATVLALIADALDVVSGIFSLDFGKVKTAMGLNLNNGQMSHMQELKYGNDWTYGGNGQWTQNSGAAGYDSSKGLWYDQNGNYIYHNASGTPHWRGGLTWVGENGPELVSLPQGSRIWNTDESRRMSSTSNVWNITVNGIRELDEIVHWYQGRQVEERMH